jgi:hypothetical protein
MTKKQYNTNGMIKLIPMLEELATKQIERLERVRFIEGVLGINLTLEESKLLLEGGQTSQELEQKIQLAEAELMGFLDTLAAKIGGIPKDLAKTFTDAAGFLKFIYNVVSDKTGENLKNAIIVMQRSAIALFRRIDRLLASVPTKIKEIFDKILAWIKKTAGTILGVKSDVDTTDKLTGDSSNWKKFLMLLLVGMLLVFLMQVPSILKNLGEDFIKDALENLFNFIPNILSKLFTSPLDLAKMVAGPAFISTIGPIITIFKSAKIMGNVQTDLLASNAWLKK